MIQQKMWKIVLSILIGSVCMTGVWSCSNVWGEECQKKPDGEPDILRIYSLDKWLDEEEEITPGPGAFMFIDPNSEVIPLLKLHICVPDGKPVTLTFPENVEMYLAQIPPIPQVPPLAISEPFLVPFPTDVWVNVKESGQNIICASTTSTCEDKVMVTGVQIDMDIHHGNSSKTEVQEEEEDTRGALTVVNRNDTDADGQVDHQDHDGVVGTQAQPKMTGQDEVDLIKLVIRKLGSDDLLNIPGFEDTMRLTIVAGQDKVVLWEDSTKQTVIPGSNGLYEFKVVDLGNTDKTVWIEAIKPSETLGDIEFELEYMERKDTVKATGIWPEIDVREASRPENRVGRHDPRMTGDDALARNKLLVWHDDGNNNAITFEIVKADIPDGGKMLDNKSPIWIQLEEKDPLDLASPLLNADVLPFCERLEKDSQKYPDSNHPKLKPPLEIYSNPIISPTVPIMTAAKKDYFVPDFVVKYGIDYDDSGALTDDEIKGEYNIFGITQFDYTQARKRYNEVYLPLALQKLGQTLCYRVSHGVWKPPQLPDLFGDYRPTQDGACTPAQETAIHGKPDSCSAPGFDVDLITIAERPTHNLGMSFTHHTSVPEYVKNADGTGGEYPRQYFDAMVTVPVYYWNSDSDASQLVRNSNYLREWILDNFLFNKKVLTYADIKSKYDAGTGVKQLTFPIPQDGYIDFTPFKTIGLGPATLNPKKHGKQPEITLSVEKVEDVSNNTYVYDISRKVTLRAFSVDDGFDYNYFKPNLAQRTLTSVSGSTMQVSFGQEGALPVKEASPAPGDVFHTTGQVPREHIDIDGEHDLVPDDPDPFWFSIEKFRIRETNNTWSTIERCGLEKCERSIQWFHEAFDSVMFLERNVPL